MSASVQAQSLDPLIAPNLRSQLSPISVAPRAAVPLVLSRSATADASGYVGWRE